MKKVFQTTFGVPDGNCFNAAVASILDLDAIPDIDPAISDVEEWRRQWKKYLCSVGHAWEARTWDENNWKYFPRGQSIACVELAPGVFHAIVCQDGIPIHDPHPGSPFLALSPEQQRQYRIDAYISLFKTTAEDQQ